jgi:hypothetical protein
LLVSSCFIFSYYLSTSEISLGDLLVLKRQPWHRLVGSVHRRPPGGGQRHTVLQPSIGVVRVVRPIGGRIAKLWSPNPGCCRGCFAERCANFWN